MDALVEKCSGWGNTAHSTCRVYRPTDINEVVACLSDAQERGLTVAHRGAGLSYGDVGLNEGGALLDLSSVNSILAYDASKGIIKVGAGCTFAKVWQTAIVDGWWPPVVPGTMHVSLGGAAAVNVHGKNHLSSGTIGDWITSLTVLRASGEVETLGASINRDGFRNLIGAIGLTGTILDVTLQLKKIPSGFLDVIAEQTRNLSATLERVDYGARNHDYSVGWVDCFAGANAVGRGVVHFADDIGPGRSVVGKGLSVKDQALPKRVAGVIPGRHAWRLLRPLTCDIPMKLLAAAKFEMAGLSRRGYQQSHAAFHFLLDYLPDWRKSYGPGGLIQYQMFVPLDASEQAFTRLLELQREHGVHSYLGVIKRHREDNYAGKYCPDGFSLAMDFPAGRKKGRLTQLVEAYEVLRHEVGGRLYAAKDSVGVGRVPAGGDPMFGNDLVKRWEACAGSREE